VEFQGPESSSCSRAVVMPKGAKPKVYPENLVTEVRRRYEDGATQTEVAESLGLGSHVIRRVMRRYGIQARAAVRRASAQRVCPMCSGRKSSDSTLCRNCCRRENNPNWKGGLYVGSDGYVRAYAPDHPWPRRNGQVLEHVRVMELLLGRRLLPTEAVHHRDHNRQNNELTNLELWNRSEHARHHGQLDIHHRQRGWHGRLT
jgi:hypothetical protein